MNAKDAAWLPTVAAILLIGVVTGIVGLAEWINARYVVGTVSGMREDEERDAKDIRDLREQISRLQRQVDKLPGNRP
jgi:hypothetical protein